MDRTVPEKRIYAVTGVERRRRFAMSLQTLASEKFAFERSAEAFADCILVEVIADSIEVRKPTSQQPVPNAIEVYREVLVFSAVFSFIKVADCQITVK